MQYSSQITSALFYVIDTFQKIRYEALGLFTYMIKTYKNQFITYIPMIHEKYVKHKLNSKAYKECIEHLLTYGTLNDLPDPSLSGN